MNRASAGDVEPAFIVASLYHTAKAYDIVTCMCSQPPWLAVGFESGAISLFNKGDDMALPALLAGHAGGTLSTMRAAARPRPQVVRSSRRWRQVPSAGLQSSAGT